MKCKTIILLLAFVLALSCASAETVPAAERLQALEAAAGISSNSNSLVGRVLYLEYHLGVHSAEGTPLADRIGALEDALGMTVNGVPFDNGEYMEWIPLKSIGYFTKDDAVRETDGETAYNNSYGGRYTRLIYTAETEGSIEYCLGGGYSLFTASIYVPERAVKSGHDHHWSTATVSVYGDGELMYTIRGFDPRSEPVGVTLDVAGVDFLKIAFDDACYYDTGRAHPLAILGDPMLAE